MADGKPLKVCWKMSRNINQIYFAQWCTIGFFTVIFVYLLEIPMPDASLMLPLCEFLGINVNELLTGEHLTMDEYIDDYFSTTNNKIELRSRYR